MSHCDLALRQGTLLASFFCVCCSFANSASSLARARVSWQRQRPAAEYPSVPRSATVTKLNSPGNSPCSQRGPFRLFHLCPMKTHDAEPTLSTTACFQHEWVGEGPVSSAVSVHFAGNVFSPSLADLGPPCSDPWHRSRSLSLFPGAAKDPMNSTAPPHSASPW